MGPWDPGGFSHARPASEGGGPELLGMNAEPTASPRPPEVGDI